MDEILSNPEFRVALATIVMLVLVQAAVRSKVWLEKNKNVLRYAIWVVLWLSAVITDWVPDNTIVWSNVWVIWSASVTATTIGHGTLIKLLEGAVPATQRTPANPG